MLIVQGTRSNPHLPLAQSVLTVGNFDGVHLGHRELVRRVVSHARAEGVPSVVMTFEPHPVQVLYPDRKLLRIFDFDDQRRELEKLGVEILVVEPFSREFSQLPADRYLREWIYRPFQPSRVIVGYDFTFGAGRQGSIAFLKESAQELAFTAEVLPPVKVGDIIVSSSRIRQAVEEGDVDLARRLLGREFYVQGLVEKGAGRGRTIGVPTANVHTSAELIPKRGVYCAWAEVRGQRFKAMVNIGLNPTFNADARHALSIEAHLLNTSLDLYGENLRLEFVDRLRDEKKFSGVQELVSQIHLDIQDGSTRLDRSDRS